MLCNSVLCSSKLYPSPLYSEISRFALLALALALALAMALAQAETLALTAKKRISANKYKALYFSLLQ